MMPTSGGRLMAVCVMLLSTSSLSAKQQSRLVTAEMRANSLAGEIAWIARQQ